jgi:hypothetical protein
MRQMDRQVGRASNEGKQRGQAAREGSEGRQLGTRRGERKRNERIDNQEGSMGVTVVKGKRTESKLEKEVKN